MIQKRIPYLLLIALSTGLFGCTLLESDSNPAVARVYEKQLLLEDLKAILPPNLNPEDSAMLSKNFIDQWVKKELKVKQAELLLNPSSKDIQKQLDDYRQSLLIHLWEKKMMDEKLDTIVTDTEVFNYYQLHLEDFILKKDLVKMIYIQLSISQYDYYKLRRSLRYSYPEEMESVYEYCSENATQMIDFNNEWVYFDDAIQLVPNKITNAKYFITNNEYNEIIESGHRHIIRVYDHKLSGDPSPLDRVWNDISNLILLKRKMELIKKLETEGYNEAMKSNKIEIFKLENE